MEMTTTYVNSTRLTCTVEAGDTVMASAGGDPAYAPQSETLIVLVRNPSPGGGDSGSLDFIVHDNFTFTIPEVLSSSDHDAGYPQISVTFDGKIDVAWMEGWGDGNRIYMRHSGDSGVTWSPVRAVPGATSRSGGSPAICRDNDGTLHFALNYGHAPNTVLRYFTSTDNGVTWSTGTNLYAWPAFGIELLAGAGKTLYLFANIDGELHLMRSTTNGSTWKVPVQISNNYAKPVHINAELDYQGNLFAIWTQLEGQGPHDHRVWFSRSLDGGASWLNQRILASAFAQHFYSVGIAAAANQHLVAAWVKNFGYSSDYAAAFRYGNKLGDTWSAIKKIESQDTRSINPAISSDSAGNVHLFIQDGGIISKSLSLRQRFWRSTDSGSNWTKPVFIKNVHPVFHHDPDSGTDAEGHVYLVFVDYLGTDRRLYFTRSQIPD